MVQHWPPVNSTLLSANFKWETLWQTHDGLPCKHLIAQNMVGRQRGSLSVQAKNQNYFCAKDKLLSQYAMRSERLYSRVAWYCDDSVGVSVCFRANSATVTEQLQITSENSIR